jgi:hypothetical protein
MQGASTNSFSTNSNKMQLHHLMKHPVPADCQNFSVARGPCILYSLAEPVPNCEAHSQLGEIRS